MTLAQRYRFPLNFAQQVRLMSRHHLVTLSVTQPAAGRAELPQSTGFVLDIMNENIGAPTTITYGLRIYH